MNTILAEPEIAVRCSECGTAIAPRPVAVSASVVVDVVDVDEQGRCPVCAFLAGS